MMVIDALPGKTVLLGRLGENEARTVRFLVGNILYHYPAATFTVLNQRPGDPAAYPVANCELDGSYVNWLLTDSDLSKVGNGQCELVARQDGVVVKTVIYTTKIDNALDGAGTPPDPWESWVDDVIDAADRADAAAALLEHPGAVAETLEPGSQATAGYSDGTFTFGIPEGEKGDPGQPGVSPSVTVTDITGGHRVTITDVSGTQTVDVMDGQNGQDGADGYSPSASVSKSGSTATITITDKTGTTSAQVSDGDPTTLIDDTSTAQNKVWSAKKSDSEVQGLKSAITQLTDGLPTEATAQELLEYETHNTGLTDTALIVIGMLFDNLPQNETLTDILNSIKLECERLDMIYDEWIAEREGA